MPTWMWPKLEARITPRTKAIIPVHLYGHPVDMDPLMQVARTHGLRVLEDASHAHGATYKGRRIGSLGDAAAFSFYPSKVLGAYGDAGAIVTNDADLAKKIRVLRYMGQEVKGTHLVIGYQERLDPMQAAILQVKLRHLEGWIEQRRAIARRYARAAGWPAGARAGGGRGLPARLLPVHAARAAPRRAGGVPSGRGIATQMIYHTPCRCSRATRTWGTRQTTSRWRRAWPES